AGRIPAPRRGRRHHAAPGREWLRLPRRERRGERDSARAPRRRLGDLRRAARRLHREREGLSLTKSTAREDDALWAAVGDPTRRQLLDALLARGGASATALAADLPVTRQAVAKHLAVLDRAGLVRAEK